MTISRMKFEGRDSEGEFAPASFDLDTDEFATLMPLVFYMGRVDSRVPAALSAIVHPYPSKVSRVILCVEMANCARCGRQLPALTFGKKICQWCLQHEAAQRGEDSPVQKVEPELWTRQGSSSMSL